MSYNSLGYFQLDLNTLTPSDKFIMRGFVNQIYNVDLYESVTKATYLKSIARTYCYKFVPKNPALPPKIYNENELIDLGFIASFVPNPYTYDFSQPILINGEEVFVDETDRDFIIIYKGNQFYNHMYSALELAKEFRGGGKYYCYYMKTPDWFEEQYNVKVDGQYLILLWQNKNYVL